jgi:hypothetical protein
VTKLLTLDLSLGFHASLRCREDLKNYYDGVGNLDPPRLSCLYPNPPPIDPSNVLPKLTYQQLLSQAGQPTSLVDLGNTTTAMYTATLGDIDQKVIVEFTLSLPRDYIFASVSSVTYIWSLWTVWMGSLFGSSKRIKYQFLKSSPGLSRMQ